MEKVIKLEGINKKFGDKEIYKGLNLEVEKGQTVGFVGENGCGKSVLFQIISGLTKVDCGKVSVNGKALGEKNDFADNVGILINEPGYIEYISGYENLKLLAEIKNIIGKKEIIEAMMKVGLDPKDKTPVKKYSMGMKQKLGIAQAIMEGQEVVILDEPYNALDFKTNKDVTEVLKELKTEGKTVLLSSHQHEYLEKLCDVIYCVYDKKVILFDEEMKKKYFSE